MTHNPSNHPQDLQQKASEIIEDRKDASGESGEWRSQAEADRYEEIRHRLGLPSGTRLLVIDDPESKIGIGDPNVVPASDQPSRDKLIRRINKALAASGVNLSVPVTSDDASSASNAGRDHPKTSADGGRVIIVITDDAPDITHEAPIISPHLWSPTSTPLGILGSPDNSIKFATSPSTDTPAHAIEASPQQHEPLQMAQIETIAIDEDGTAILKGGLRYLPLAVAAPVVQAPASTILHWIKTDTNFGEKPLQSYYFSPANQYFVSEESIQRAANRFVKWPSQEAAGAVTLGPTKDKSGFLVLSEAQRILGVSKRTMYLWATQGKAPTEEQPDVIQCPTSQHFHIREKDVYALKKRIPRSGLTLGRRPQLAPSP